MYNEKSIVIEKFIMHVVKSNDIEKMTSLMSI